MIPGLRGKLELRIKLAAAQPQGQLVMFTSALSHPPAGGWFLSFSKERKALAAEDRELCMNLNF